MSIKIDLRNQVRQTNLPKWKPLLPLFEAIMSSFQDIRDLGPSHHGKVTVEVIRESSLLPDETPLISGFRVTDDGIGLTDENFDSFNTAFSPHKLKFGGKGLGRFTWLKAFEKANIVSIFNDKKEGALKREFTFDESYDLDKRGIPVPAINMPSGTTVCLIGFRDSYRIACPRSSDVLIEKIIEHFLLVLLEKNCPRLFFVDGNRRQELNSIFDKEYRQRASTHALAVGDVTLSLHGFRLPTTRTTKHKIVYAAHQRAVVSDNLEDHVPNLKSRLIDENGEGFFYLGIIQGDYLSDHVTSGRIDFDFDASEDADATTSDMFSGITIRRADIRREALPFIQSDLSSIIESINALKIERIRAYVHEEAPQYRILLRHLDSFINKLPPQPSKVEMETTLHRELHQREVNVKQESSKIIKEAEKVDDYADYSKRFADFIGRYNELGVSALAQYVAHRKIILDLLEKSITIPEGKKKYPLEKVVHQLVFPMRQSSDDTPYTQQNLWMIDERLTFRSFISSDNPLNQHPMLEADSQKREDIVIFDERIIFGDVRVEEHPINSITIIEFKRPGRNDYNDGDNPVRQAFRLVDDIRSSKFKINGRSISVANKDIPATVYCICDITPTLHQVLKDQDALLTPDNQSYYGFNKNYGVYFEVIDYNKMLRDARRRNRIFFDKLNLVNNHA
ncbi:ATP-binding protein [Methylorubrum aminovorans]